MKKFSKVVGYTIDTQENHLSFYLLALNYWRENLRKQLHLK